jgi:tetratricopeptide (TPR) repeat protein
MISIIVRKRFLIAWISLLPLLGWGQSLDQCYQHASSQLQLGNYENAVSAFHRVLYFDDGRYSSDALFQLAKSYQMIGEYEKARKFLDQSYAVTDNDSLRAEIIFEKSIAFTLSGNFYFALMELMNIPDDATTENRKRAHFHMGINYFQLESFDASKKEFRKYLTFTDSSMIDSLDYLFDQLRKLKRYRPNLAAGMSLVVPGSGQLYAGYPGEALNSFLLVGSFEVLFFVVAARYSLLDTYLTIVPWLQRYLYGGFKGAKRLTLERRAERKDEIYRELLQYISRQ